MKPGRVEVHVAELVLHGFAPLDRIELQEGLVRQLESALGTFGLRSEPARGQAPDGGTLNVAADVAPGELGGQIGRAVAGKLTERSLGGGD